MRITVLVSDPDQATLIREVLVAAGHDCHISMNGMDLADQIRDESVDLLLLDLQLPSQSAADTVRTVRESLPSLPVLVLAARTDEDGISTALAAGASDYQVKPLRRGELSLRVRTLLKRTYPERLDAEIIRFGKYAFEPRCSQLSANGVQIELTQKEFALALLFFRNLGRPLSRAYMQENVWSRDADIPSRTIDTHVSRVRSKLGLRPENGFRLVPVYSYGYKLEQLAG